MSDQEVKVDIFKERIFPVLFMLIVTVVFIALVSGIYLATRDNVLRNERLYLMRAVLYAADIQVPEDAAAIESRYNDLVQEVLDSDDNLLYYELEGAGYVFPAFGPGLWGEIEAVVGFDRELRRITGVDFIKQNETPGLGARISEDWFRDQFRGKTGPFSRVPEGTETRSPTEFDAITGATITSTAIQNILNDTIKEAPDILGGK